MAMPATAEDLLAIRDPAHRYELVRGELRRMSLAGWVHGRVAGLLHIRIGAHVAEHGPGVTFAAETGFLLAREPDTVRAPDVAFVRAARIPQQPARGWFPGPPDLAVEVVSPGDTFAEVESKALCWLEHGTLLVWIVEPRARTVTALRSAADVRILREDEMLDAPDLLPGFAIRVRDLLAW